MSANKWEGERKGEDNRWLHWWERLKHFMCTFDSQQLRNVCLSNDTLLNYVQKSVCIWWAHAFLQLLECHLHKLFEYVCLVSLFVAIHLLLL